MFFTSKINTTKHCNLPGQFCDLHKDMVQIVQKAHYIQLEHLTAVELFEMLWAYKAATSLITNMIHLLQFQ